MTLVNVWNLKPCNVGITERRDLRSAPLKWTQVARYVL
jgi:hypothetical protein